MSVFIPKDNTIAVTNYTGIPAGDSVVNVYDVVEGVISDYPAISGEYNIVYPVSSIGTTSSRGMVVNKIIFHLQQLILRDLNCCFIYCYKFDKYCNSSDKPICYHGY